MRQGVDEGFSDCFPGQLSIARLCQNERMSVRPQKCDHFRRAREYVPVLRKQDPSPSTDRVKPLGILGCRLEMLIMDLDARTGASQSISHVVPT